MFSLTIANAVFTGNCELRLLSTTHRRIIIIIFCVIYLGRKGVRALLAVYIQQLLSEHSEKA